jgi:sugar/nucleoside kinase (ribokinase family)
MPKVLVVGDVMTDVVVKPEGPIAVGADTRASIRVLPGGSGANQACWLAREGISTRFAGRVGAADRPREKLLFAEHGVDARLAADESLPTGTLITLLAHDERSFLTDRAANMNLCRADLPDALLDGIDLLHISGYAFFEAGPREAVLKLFAEAARLRIPTSVDPSSYSFLAEIGPEQFIEWTRGARFLFPNEDEAATLTGAAKPGAQLDFLTRVYPIVAIKRGSAGAIAGDSDGDRSSALASPADVVDTSGAGDAFLGGFLGAYLKGEGIEAALKRGVALGSQSVASIGARP